MKVVILILSLVAVAYAAPAKENRQFKAFVEKLLASQQQTDEDTPEIEALLQKNNEQENKEENLLSFLAQMQNDDLDEDEDVKAIIDEYKNIWWRPRNGWSRKTWRRFKGYVRKNKENILRYGIRFFGR